MSKFSIRRTPWLRKGLPAAAAILVMEACGLTSIQQPALTGPSTTNLDITLHAQPDILTADDVSKSVVTATVRTGTNPAPGVSLAFNIFEGSSIVGLGNLNTFSGVTDGNGQVRVVYTAPARTDVDNQIFIQIGARPEQGDANGRLNYRTVTIELRPAEPSQFPQVPGLTNLNCTFAIEPALPGSFSPGLQVLFQDTSSDPNTGGKIIRYQWNFGDGTIGDDSPDVNHAYSLAGTYTVSHVITDNLGESATCTNSVDVQSVTQGGVPLPMGAPKRITSAPKRSRP